MKHILFIGSRLLAIIIFSCITLFTVAQETKTVTTKTTTTFHIEPWMWIVGGAVLVVILVALLRGGSSREVSRTTVIKNEK